MTFEFEEKPPQQEAAGAGKEQASRQPAAEVAAERRRVFDQAAAIARLRRQRIAAVQGGRLPRESLDASERILLEAQERRAAVEERPRFIDRLAKRFAGSGLGVLISSIVTTVSSFTNNCTTNPFLYRLGGVLFGLSLVVLAIALALWIYEQFLL